MHRICFALVVFLATPTATLSDLRGQSEAPSFTGEELRIIERNAALGAIVSEDPWIVRNIIDALRAEREAGRLPSTDLDSANPDLDGLERSSPQGAHDLLQLLKRVGAGTNTRK